MSPNLCNSLGPFGFLLNWIESLEETAGQCFTATKIFVLYTSDTRVHRCALMASFLYIQEEHLVETILQHYLQTQYSKLSFILEKTIFNLFFLFIGQESLDKV